MPRLRKDLDRYRTTLTWSQATELRVHPTDTGRPCDAGVPAENLGVPVAPVDALPLLASERIQGRSCPLCSPTVCYL